jgi:hypothetical protein
LTLQPEWRKKTDGFLQLFIREKESTMRMFYWSARKYGVAAATIFALTWGGQALALQSADPSVIPSAAMISLVWRLVGLTALVGN